MRSSRIKRLWCRLFYGHEWIFSGSSSNRIWVCGYCNARPAPGTMNPPPPPGFGPGEKFNS